uniref:Beta-lactamase-related domain-containing protein n=1 Tax=Phaeocystis antarctica TaxID=33657 RepID=A0A7S0EMW5_9EUKA
MLAFVCQSAAASLLDSDGLRTKLQAIADAKAKQYDCAIAIGVQTGTEAIAVASHGSAVTDRFVWGSVTKQFTGVALLQLAEAGTLDLDAPVHPQLDPILTRLGLRSLTTLFGKEAAKITARHLASMQSGVPDFDTAQPFPRPPTDAFRAEVYAKPTHDWGPAGLINQSWVATGSLKFTPGEKTQYSSTNFVLLGLLLAQLTGASTWDAYEQRSLLDPLPAARRALYRQLTFAVHGAPANQTNVHGYDRTSYNGGDPAARPGRDVWKVSGVYGGWTASDVTASVADIARFGYDLYGTRPPQLLSAASRAIMVPPEVPQGSLRFPYGFAAFNLSGMISGRPSDGPYRTAYGHLGATYGYQSILAYYPGADVAISVASNIEQDTQVQPSDTLCSAYNAVLPVLTPAAEEQCAFASTGYFGGCACDGGGTYECSRLLHMCVRSKAGSLSKSDCEASCGGMVEAVAV